MIGRFGYGPADKSTPLWMGFVQPKFVHDPSARIPALEQAGSEYLFVASALALNKLVSRDGTLDIRLVGFVHLAAFLAALALLLRVTGPAFWIVALIIFTGVGYAAYWNSLYTEPATCIFLVLLLAESIRICFNGALTAQTLGRWCLWAALLVWAKSSNYPIGILLALFAVRLAFLGKGTRVTGLIGASVIAAVTFVTMWTRPQPMQWATTYNSIFMAILPESRTPAADLETLGLDPRLASFSGTGAWTQRTAFPDLVSQGVLRDRVTGTSVARFYLTHPARIWRRAKSLLPIAFSLRPEWCGNFERSAGRPPGAKDESFSPWSAFHERILGPIGRFILIALVIAPLAAIALWFKSPRRRLAVELCALLAACALVAFLTAACGDAWDNVKHMFLFNLLLDLLLLAIVQLTASRIART